ncbi:hypothetical protein C4K38_4002 [Pseudomonas chlororaphis subsp. piscium]|nr:hypothetical protein C4K38_4002 [Pseudomonas chlororaphis subsp. piscium]SDS77686.1 hypothetical protein SAMN05216585_3385 [Pseudomonas chlororaphis]
MTKNQQKIGTGPIGIVDTACILWGPLDEQQC